MDRLSPSQFQAVYMNDILTVEGLLTLNILFYDIDFVDGNIVAELASAELWKNCAIAIETTTTYATWTT